MAFDNNDVEPTVEEAGPPPEENSNRPFLLVAGILGAIMLLSLLCVAAYVFLLYPQRRASNATAVAEANTRATAAALSVNMTQQASKWTATPRPVIPTITPQPTNTPVLAVPTNTLVPTTDPRTATVAVLLTQAAAAQRTPAGPTITALPASGFADDVGAPGLMGAAVVLIAVIFLARRLRTAV